MRSSFAHFRTPDADTSPSRAASASADRKLIRMNSASFIVAAILPQSGEDCQPQNGKGQQVSRYVSFPAMGNRLKELREEAGWTHDQAASAMGVSRGQFIKLERGERRMTADYMARAAKA